MADIDRILLERKHAREETLSPCERHRRAEHEVSEAEKRLEQELTKGKLLLAEREALKAKETAHQEKRTRLEEAVREAKERREAVLDSAAAEAGKPVSQADMVDFLKAAAAIPEECRQAANVTMESLMSLASVLQQARAQQEAQAAADRAAAEAAQDATDAAATAVAGVGAVPAVGGGAAPSSNPPGSRPISRAPTEEELEAEWSEYEAAMGAGLPDLSEEQRGAFKSGWFGVRKKRPTPY